MPVLGAIHQPNLRKIAAALAVLLLHVAAIRMLLGVRDLFERLIAERPQTVTTLIFLPPESLPVSLSKSAPPAPAAALSISPLVRDGPSFAVPSQTMTTLTPIVPALTLPELPANPDARVFVNLGDYFACNFANYDRLTDAERERCALRLSNLGHVAALPGAYVDSKATPFTLFGAEGTFAFTPPAQRSFDLLQSSIGCAWEQGLCRMWQFDKFGLDPDDQKRATAAAHFELAKGWSLDAGAQAWMENYLGGARLALTAGVVLTYRW